MLTNTCNPRTQETEKEDPELQASKGYISRPCGVREKRRKGKSIEEEERKEKQVWPGGGVFGYDDRVLKDLKAQSNLTTNCKLHNCLQHLLNY